MKTLSDVMYGLALLPLLAAILSQFAAGDPGDTLRDESELRRQRAYAKGWFFVFLLFLYAGYWLARFS